MNDPIKGLGRLRRIGISFSEDQKKLITSLAESGDILGAQTEIIKELEFELGQVSRAMGRSSLGTIKKYKNAWTNLFEEVGEQATNFFAKFAPGGQSFIEKITADLAGSNARDLINNVLDIEGLDQASIQKLVPKHEIQSALADVLQDVAKFEKQLKQAFTFDPEGNKIENLSVTRDLRELLGPLKEEQSILNGMLQDYDAIARIQASLTDDADDGIVLKDGAEAWLAELIRVENQKSKILGLDEISAGFDSQKFSRETQYRSLVKKGVDLGYEKITIEGILNTFSLAYEASLIEQEKVARALVEGKKQEVIETKRLADIDNYGTEEQQKIEATRILIEGIRSAMREENIERQHGLDLIKEARKITEDEGINNNFFSILAEQLGGAVKEGEILNDVLSSVADTLIGFASGSFVGIFESMGNSVAGVSEETESFELTMLKMTQSALEAAGPMFFLAAARSVAELGTAGIPAAAGYLALAAASGFGAGFLGQSISNASDKNSESGVTSSTAINTTTLDFGTDVSASRSSAPNIQTNIINNTGAQVTARATVGNDGQILLETVIDKAVTATGNTYGLQKAGRNVR